MIVNKLPYFKWAMGLCLKGDQVLKMRRIDGCEVYLITCTVIIVTKTRQVQSV